jgi:hypothetical protein
MPRGFAFENRHFCVAPGCHSSFETSCFLSLSGVMPLRALLCYATSIRIHAISSTLSKKKRSVSSRSHVIGYCFSMRMLNLTGTIVHGAVFDPSLKVIGNQVLSKKLYWIAASEYAGGGVRVRKRCDPPTWTGAHLHGQSSTQKMSVSILLLEVWRSSVRL